MSSSREIKVRFWYKGRAGMTSHVYTLGEILNGDPFEDYCDNKLADWRMMFERDEWTGLADKNGRGIYEGDIVKLEGVVNGLVTFEWGCFVWNEINGAAKRAFDQISPQQEVIGNIHENPNLLKGKV